MARMSSEAAAYMTAVRNDGWNVSYGESTCLAMGAFCRKHGIGVVPTGAGGERVKKDYARALVHTHFAPDGFGGVQLPREERRVEPPVPIRLNGRVVNGSLAGTLSLDRMPRSGGVESVQGHNTDDTDNPFSTESASRNPRDEHADLVERMQEESSPLPIPSSRKEFDGASCEQLRRVACQHGLRLPRGADKTRRDAWWNLLGVLGYIPGVKIRSGTRLSPVRVKAAATRC